MFTVALVGSQGWNDHDVQCGTSMLIPVTQDKHFSILHVVTLNVILLQDLRINIKGVNILEPVFRRERDIPYKHYHLEITATNDQEIKLKKSLLDRGLAIDIKPFELAKHQETDHANDVQDSHCVSEGNRYSNHSSSYSKILFNCRE